MGKPESSGDTGRCSQVGQLHDWLRVFAGLQEGESCVLPVLSGSMSPHLLFGGSVRARHCSWRECRPGDIIVFREGARLVAHRCLWRIRLGERCLLFQKGDCSTFGGLLQGARVLGVASEAWDPDGAPSYTRDLGTAKADVRRQIRRDTGARLLFVPRLAKRLLWRAFRR